jgi:hypothetical protein
MSHVVINLFILLSSLCTRTSFLKARLQGQSLLRSTTQLWISQSPFFKFMCFCLHMILFGKMFWLVNSHQSPSKFFHNLFDAGLHDQRTLSKKTLIKFLMEQFDCVNEPLSTIIIICIANKNHIELLQMSITSTLDNVKTLKSNSFYPICLCYTILV